MSLLYMVCDPYANLLGRGPTPTSNPEDVDATGLQVDSINANGDFAPARLVDGRADIVYMPSTVSLGYKIYRNVNLVADHAIKIGGVLGVAWTTIVLGPGSYAYQDIKLRAGEQAQLLGTALANGGNAVLISLQNQETGRWLQPGGTWGGASSAISITGGGSSTVTFNVEDLKAMGGVSICNVRIIIQTGGGSNIKDVLTNCEVIPAVNCAWIYGHTIPGGDTISLISGSTNALATTNGAAAIGNPGCYIYLSTPVIARWWGIRVGTLGLTSGDNRLYSIAEAFIGYASSPSRSQKWAWREEEDWPQLRQQNAAGQSWAYTITTTRTRRLELTFAPYDTSGTLDNLVALRTLRDDMWLRSNGGAYPVAVIARDTRPDIVFGRLSQKLGVTHALPNMQETSITLDPFPPPVVGP